MASSGARGPTLRWALALGGAALLLLLLPTASAQGEGGRGARGQGHGVGRETRVEAPGERRVERPDRRGREEGGGGRGAGERGVGVEGRAGIKGPWERGVWGKERGGTRSRGPEARVLGGGERLLPRACAVCGGRQGPTRVSGRGSRGWGKTACRPFGSACGRPGPRARSAP